MIFKNITYRVYRESNTSVAITISEILQYFTYLWDPREDFCFHVFLFYNKLRKKKNNVGRSMTNWIYHVGLIESK